MPAIREKTGRFAKGTSGNPSGRPRRTDAERALLEELYLLAPQAANAIRQILEDETCPPNVRLRACEVILERCCGRPMNITQILDEEEQIRIDATQFFK